MYPLYFLYDQWPVLLLRLALGVILVVHGWPKLRNLGQNAKNFSGMGFRPGWLFGTIAAILEFFGGIGLALGLMTTLIALFVSLEFLVILFWRWVKRMPFVGGWEFDLLIFAAAISLFALGAGAYSLDRVWFGVL